MSERNLNIYFDLKENDMGEYGRIWEYLRKYRPMIKAAVDR